MKVTTDTPDMLIIDDRPILMAIMLTVFILTFVGAGLAIVMSGEWLGLLFGLMGGGLGFAAFAVFVRRVQVVFYRPEGWIEIRKRSIFGMKTVRHNLTEIARAEIEKTRSTSSGSSSSGSMLYRIALVIETGQSKGRHPVTEAYSSGSGHQRCAEAINRWLGATRAR